MGQEGDVPCAGGGLVFHTHLGSNLTGVLGMAQEGDVPQEGRGLVFPYTPRFFSQLVGKSCYSQGCVIMRKKELPFVYIQDFGAIRCSKRQYWPDQCYGDSKITVSPIKRLF